MEHRWNEEHSEGHFSAEKCVYRFKCAQRIKKMNTLSLLIVAEITKIKKAANCKRRHFLNCNKAMERAIRLV